MSVVRTTVTVSSETWKALVESRLRQDQRVNGGPVRSMSQLIEHFIIYGLANAPPIDGAQPPKGRMANSKLKVDGAALHIR